MSSLVPEKFHLVFEEKATLYDHIRQQISFFADKGTESEVEQLLDIRGGREDLFSKLSSYNDIYWSSFLDLDPLFQEVFTSMGAWYSDSGHDGIFLKQLFESTSLLTYDRLLIDKMTYASPEYLSFIFFLSSLESMYELKLEQEDELLVFSDNKRNLEIHISLYDRADLNEVDEDEKGLGMEVSIHSVFSAGKLTYEAFLEFLELCQKIIPSVVSIIYLVAKINQIEQTLILSYSDSINTEFFDDAD